MFLSSFFKKRYIDYNHNSFDILRLILALSVILSHAAVLGYYRDDILIDIGNEKLSIGSFSVYLFFVISGILITRSGVNSTSVGSFIKKRLLRIFPAYWASLLFGAFIITPLIYKFRGVGFSYYFQNFWVEYTSYIYQNIAADVQFRYIGYVFNDIPSGVLNGSLWTLIHELRMYILIALLMTFGVVNKVKYYVMIFIAYYFIYILGHSTIFPFHKELYLILDSKERHTIDFGTYFLAGSLLFHFSKQIFFSWFNFVCAIAITALGLMYGFYPIVGPFAFVYIVGFLSIILPFRSIVSKIGDLSYGVYIYAFPIQILLTVLNVHLYGFYIYTGLSVILTLIISFMSYHLLEKHYLKKKEDKQEVLSSDKPSYLIICGSSYPTLCGVGKYAHKSANILAKNGHEVFYLANETQSAETKTNSEKILYKLEKIQIVWKNLFQILGFVKTNNIEVINIQYNTTEFGRQIFPTFLAIILKIVYPKIKLQVTIHEFANYTKLGKIRHIIPCLVADKCLFSDTNQLNSAISFAHGLISKKSEKIPIGSNVKFNVSGNGPSLLKNKTINIVFHGLIQPKNGLEYLVKALNELKKSKFKLHLHILGDFKLLVNYGEKNQEISEYQQNTLAYIKKNIGSKTTIYGDVDPNSDKFYEILKKMSIYVAPDTDGLTVRRTSFWNVFLQSDAIGVGTYVSGISDPELNSLVVLEPKSTESIISAINKLLSSSPKEVKEIYSYQLMLKKSMRTEEVDNKIYEVLTN